MRNILSLYADAGWVSDPCFLHSSFSSALIFSIFFVGILVGGLMIILLASTYLLVRIVMKVKHSKEATIKKVNKIFSIAGFVGEFVLFVCILLVALQHSECWQ